MQETKAVQSADEQGQEGQKPTNEETIRMVMANMLQSLVRFAIVEALVFDLPPAARHTIKRQAGDFPLR